MRAFRFIAPLVLLASCASPAFADPVSGVDISQTGIGYGATGSTFVPVSVANPLPVTGGGGGTEYTFGVAGAAAPVGAAVICIRDDVLASVEADGDNLVVRCNGKGELYIKAIDTDALLTTQAGYLDGIEGLIGTTNTNTGSAATLLTTQAGYLDGLETLITGILNGNALLDPGGTVF
jgi:hypothetical protein